MTDDTRQAETRRPASRAADQARPILDLLPAFLDNARAGMALKDLSGKYQLVNAMFEELAGIGRDGLVGRTDAEIFPPEVAERILREEEEVRLTGLPVEAEFSVLRDGAPQDWLVTRFPLFDGEGSMAGLGTLCTNITERRGAEERLRESERKYRMLYEQAVEGILLTDERMRILDANPKAQAMLGRSIGRLRGLSYLDFIHPDDSGIKPDSSGKLTGGRSIRLERRILAAGGGYFHADLAAKRIGSDLIQIVIRDISQHKMLEDDLRRAKHAAEEASRAKGDFLANMSHEMRTPLSGILGMTDLALSTTDPEAQQRYLRLVQTAAKSLLGIIDDILDLSKIEAGTFQLVTVEFSPREALDATLSPLHLEASAKGLALVCNVEDSVPAQVKGDRGRLEQVVRNLVANAVKFTEKGSVTVTMSAPSGSGPGTDPDLVTLRVAVGDTGPGIAPEKLGLLFQNFSQLDEAVSKRYGGTGLGLAISRRIVERMGGTIDVTSEPGRGSEFAFTARFGALGGQDGIPARAIRVADEGTAEPAPAPKPAQQPLSILLAEDNPLNQLYLEALLRRSGHRVVVAQDGRQALDNLDRQRFDLVLMDVQMPDVDGLEATRRIRAGATSHDPDVPIVALTAFAMKGDREKFLSAGMNDYLAKPVEREQLLDAIARHGRPGAAQETPAPPPETPPRRPFRSGPSAPARSLGDSHAPEREREFVRARLESLRRAPGLPQRMASIFLSNLPPSFAKFQEAIMQGDADAAGAQAHALVNTCLAVGADSTGEVLRGMEEMLRDGRLEEARRGFPELKRRIDYLTALLSDGNFVAGAAASG